MADIAPLLENPLGWCRVCRAHNPTALKNTSTGRWLNVALQGIEAMLIEQDKLETCLQAAAQRLTVKDIMDVPNAIDRLLEINEILDEEIHWLHAELDRLYEFIISRQEVNGCR
ncbi:MAG: hypothetical protein JW829_21410 [Pirellulales bacterium]|nr:hypothetical protein [Pirellulales bacterium]